MMSCWWSCSLWASVHTWEFASSARTSRTQSFILRMEKYKEMPKAMKSPERMLMPVHRNTGWPCCCCLAFECASGCGWYMIVGRGCCYYTCIIMTTHANDSPVIHVGLIPRLSTSAHCVRHRSPTSPVITAGTDTSWRATSLRLVPVALTPMVNRSGEPSPAVQLSRLHRQS